MVSKMWLEKSIKVKLVTPKPCVQCQWGLSMGKASPVLKASRGRIPVACNRASKACHHWCKEHCPPQDDKPNRTGGRQSVVIEILAEQNLVCAIIVRRALTEAKIHSTWCLHCFQPNTHQAPHLQSRLLYNNSSRQKQLKDNCRTTANMCWMLWNVVLWTE